MGNQIFWESKFYNVNIDISGKEIGDSVPSPITANELIKRMDTALPVLNVRLGDILAVFSTFYCRGEGGLSQVVFVTNLETTEDLTIKYLILSDSEFTIIGE